MRFLILASIMVMLATPSLFSQTTIDTSPTVGLRDGRPSSFALSDAKVVIGPGSVIDRATVLVENGLIVAVGHDLEVPKGFDVIPCQGKWIYAGFIDAWSEQAVKYPQKSGAYWNQNIVPHRSVAELVPGADQANALRKQGFVARLVAPQGAIVKGRSSVFLLKDSGDQGALIRKNVWQHAQLTVPRNGPGERYPNSPMGATALLRQALYDAKWYDEALEVYRANPKTEKPEHNLALESLAKEIHEGWFLFDAPNERMALRAEQIAREFSIKIAIRGSGREYRDLDSIAALKRPLLIPVNFPEKPRVKSVQSLENLSLRELMHWDLAPTNPAKLAAAGVRFCLTTDGLDDVSKFLSQLRVAVKAGLDAEIALAAVTTVPAELLGLGDALGTIEEGKLANLVVLDGNLFSDETKVLECWVAGTRHHFESVGSPKKQDQWLGEWLVDLPTMTGARKTRIELRSENQDLVAEFSSVVEPGDLKKLPADDEKKRKRKPKKVSTGLNHLTFERDRIAGQIELTKLYPDAAPGITLLSIIGVDTPSNSQSNQATLFLQLPDGSSRSLSMKLITRDEVTTNQDNANSKPKEAQPEPKESKLTENDSLPEKKREQANKLVDTPLLKPFGAYGLDQPLNRHSLVMFRHATIWTCGEEGVLENADLLIGDGEIIAVGVGLEVPEDALVINLEGKHLTPGLIDCHSHMGTDGGVNESGQAVTSEVRIGDFLDNSDINIYRQLAGGLTVSNILHGSANPIGGQNQVIKLRWGGSMESLRMKEAPAGIKFALGENVKRSPTRYPNTRMGVEQIIGDQLLAAREYEAKWRRWRSGVREGLPPRRDLQLEALVEVQRGKRWVHCHSYRQDEIVAVLNVLEEFGVQIGTLQHILEGYKVADRLKKHGAMASAFSDWWAYKFEVFDAIPYNGAMMHDQGIVVSFNSDDRELGRHLNTEAAKATKYGGVPEEEALKFVTLNPAKQLRIDHVVGSLVPGKHADLTVWSGRPLSTLTRCEQTWIDGVKYFDIQVDQTLRLRDQKLKSQLVQKALQNSSPGSIAGGEASDVNEEDRWVRKDVYCAVHGGLRHETAVGQGEKK